MANKMVGENKNKEGKSPRLDIKGKVPMNVGTTTRRMRERGRVGTTLKVSCAIKKSKRKQ